MHRRCISIEHIHFLLYICLKHELNTIIGCSHIFFQMKITGRKRLIAATHLIRNRNQRSKMTKKELRQKKSDSDNEEEVDELEIKYSYCFWLWK